MHIAGCLEGGQAIPLRLCWAGHHNSHPSTISGKPLIVAQPYTGFDPFTPAEKEARLTAQRQTANYLHLLQLRLEDLEPGYARMVLPFRQEISHSGGVVQGGLLTTLADSCIAHATIAASTPDQYVTTIEVKINFIRAAKSTDCIAQAALLHLGRRTAVGEAEIRDPDGRMIAKCLSSLMVLPAEGKQGPGAS